VPKDPQKLRLVLVGEHPATLDALALLLRSESDLQVIGVFPLDKAQPDRIRKASPNVLLFDFDTPSPLWMLRIRELRRSLDDTKLLVYTACSDQETLLELLSLSIEGLVHKSNETRIVLKSIRSVARGEFWVYRQLLVEAVRRKERQGSSQDLTSRENEIVRLVITGASNKTIADRLGVSVLTVKRHLSNIFTKLNITSRMQLAIRYTQPPTATTLHPK
jgi:two-component system nitrate/nitrite response regulator NarL